MSHTNQTTNYHLPQFLGSDKPSWLTDINGAFSDIDTAIYEAKSEADGQGTTIGELQSTVTSQGNTISDHTTAISGLRTDVDANAGSISTINSLIGSGSPTTSNQTIIGAINATESSIAPAEDSATLGASYAQGAQFARGGTLYTALTALTAGTAFTNLVLNTDYKVSDPLVSQLSSGGVVTAAGVSYDNTSSGLTADDVQEAIDEIVAALPSAGAVEIQSGTLTAGQTTVTLTFTEQAVGSTSLIDVYVEDGLNYTAIATTSTTVTLTFESQATNKAVAVRVTN